ncbi:hypothetical protein [Pseudarthrobacter sp. S9]|uniref:hypothetical protein n=1 Tax=Pseudarthrobacter sp. S9 TaxID=3418421 RepID=UPI003D0520E8
MRRATAWVTAGLIITILCGMFYAVQQQTVRRSANTEPAAAVERELQLIDFGSHASAEPALELNQNSGPFVIVYSADNTAETGTAVLDGTLPAMPDGVLDFARTHGLDRITWQPRPDLRMALVIKPAAGGKAVVGGQSLTPFEDRDRQSLLFTVLGWLASLLTLGAGFAATQLRRTPAPQTATQPEA